MLVQLRYEYHNFLLFDSLILSCCSGAWLGTVRHLLENVLIERKFPNEDIPASQSTLRCEDASFFFFHHMFEVKKDPNPSWGMSPIQTVDLLDFSGEDLSCWLLTSSMCFTG